MKNDADNHVAGELEENVSSMAKVEAAKRLVALWNKEQSRVPSGHLEARERRSNE